VAACPRDQAEAHAEAARDFIMAELVTKADLLATKQDLQTESRSLTAELRASIAELRTELRSSIAEVGTSIAEVRGSVETQSLRLTVRLGAMLAVAIGALAAIMKLTQ
jgi:septal ring factor EnvC (AmiA/AmiB activator)